MSGVSSFGGGDPLDQFLEVQEEITNLTGKIGKDNAQRIFAILDKSFNAFPPKTDQERTDYKDLAEKVLSHLTNDEKKSEVGKNLQRLAETINKSITPAGLSKEAIKSPEKLLSQAIKKIQTDGLNPVLALLEQGIFFEFSGVHSNKEWELIEELITACHENVQSKGSVEISSKIISIIYSKENSLINEGLFLSLMEAIKNGNESEIEMLIDAKIDLNQQNELGETPLHIAVKSGQTQIVKMLINAHADLNIPDSGRNYTPLHWAIIYQMLDIIDLLLEAKPDLEKQDIYNQTALQLAKNDLIIQDVIDEDENELQENAIKITKILIQAGADPSKLDNHGYTLLHFAIKANATVVNPDEKQALWMPEISQEIVIDLIDALKKKNPQFLNIPSRDGLTPLVMTFIENADNEEIFNALLEAGINANQKYEGKSLLRMACESGEKSVIESLRKKGAALTPSDLTSKAVVKILQNEAEKLARVWLNGLPNLEDLLALGVNNLLTNLISQPQILIEAFQADSKFLELCLEAQSPELLHAICKELRMEQFYGALEVLKSKGLDVEFIERNTPFEVLLEHLRKGIAEPEIDDVPSIKSVQGVFVNYLNTEMPKFALTVNQQTADIPKGGLNTLFENIEKKTIFLGTPSKEPALSQFYKYIENCLKNVFLKLEKSDNTAEIEATFKELDQAGYKCGGEYYSCALRLYKKWCLNIEAEDPRENVYNTLCELRALLCEQMATGEQSVHIHNTIVRVLGEMLAIPGRSMIAQFDDMFGEVQPKLDAHGNQMIDSNGNIVTNEAEVRAKYFALFQKLYTQKTIIDYLWDLSNASVSVLNIIDNTVMKVYPFQNIIINILKRQLPKEWVESLSITIDQKNLQSLITELQHTKGMEEITLDLSNLTLKEPKKEVSLSLFELKEIIEAIEKTHKEAIGNIKDPKERAQIIEKFQAQEYALLKACKIHLGKPGEYGSEILNREIFDRSAENIMKLPYADEDLGLFEFKKLLIPVALTSLGVLKSPFKH